MNEIKEIKYKRSFILIKNHIDNLYHNGNDRVRMYYGIDYVSQLFEDNKEEKLIIYDRFKSKFNNFNGDELKELVSRYFDYKYIITIEND